jgi:hypothetical protein
MLRSDHVSQSPLSLSLSKAARADSAKRLAKLRPLRYAPRFLFRPVGTGHYERAMR